MPFLLLGLLLLPGLLQAGDCLEGQRAILLVDTRFQSEAGARHAVNDPLYLGIASQSLQARGLTLIDPKVAQKGLTEAQKTLILQGDVVGALEAAQRMKATLLVNVYLTAFARPLPGLTTNLRSVSGQIAVKAIDARDGRLLGEARRSFRKVGLGIEGVLPGLLEQSLPGLWDRLFAAACPRIAPPETLERRLDEL
ncbi:MAG: hypothetical protein D6819_05075 [Gammaproteobacteria bacterium]|nr:MAG: hypothetical protein D6819_05075 [Gammaproteobacteria bacterium]